MLPSAYTISVAQSSNVALAGMLFDLGNHARRRVNAMVLLEIPRLLRERHIFPELSHHAE